MVTYFKRRGRGPVTCALWSTSRDPRTHLSLNRLGTGRKDFQTPIHTRTEAKRTTPTSRLSAPVKIRPATQADKSPVLEFCTNTWPGGDYIPEVWDDWLRDARGRLVVATVSGSPVGIAHASLQTRSVAWLEGVRVHPSYRGRGIAGKLNIALTRFAAEKGATVARLCTGSMNKASKRHLDKVRFRLLQRFQRLHSVKPLKRWPSGIVRPRKYTAAMWKWLVSRQEFE